MLTLLITQFLVTFICALTGHIFYLFTDGKDDLKARPFIYHLFTGLIIITSFSQIWILFFPLTILFSILVSAFVVAISVIHRKKILPYYSHFLTNFSGRSGWVLLAGCLFTILVLNSGPIFMDDTDSYHIQAVKWIKEYGTVPGLANLNQRLGFNSSWFSSIGFFVPDSRKTNFFTSLNGVISTWLCFYLVFKFSRNSLGERKSGTTALASLLIFLLGMICWPMIRGNSTNANYDFITTAFTIVLFIESIDSDLGQDSFSMGPEWLLWPIYLFTVRIINFPFLLLSGAFIIFSVRKGNLRTSYAYLLTGSLLIMPFLIRNYILSGYVFYPSLFADIFHPDWKADREATQHILDFITYFNRVSTAYQPIEQTRALDFPNWIPYWFKYQFNYDKLILLTAIPGLLVGIFKFRSVLKSTATRVIAVMFLIQILSWFFIAPDPRFIYGCLLCTTSIPIFLLRDRQITSTGITNVICLSGGILLGVYSLHKIVSDNRYRNYLMPMALPKPTTHQLIINRCIVNVPDAIPGNWNARCFGTTLPCSIDPGPNLDLRGPTINEGFRLINK